MKIRKAPLFPWQLSCTRPHQRVATSKSSMENTRRCRWYDRRRSHVPHRDSDPMSLHGARAVVGPNTRDGNQPLRGNFQDVPAQRLRDRKIRAGVLGDRTDAGPTSNGKSMITAASMDQGSRLGLVPSTRHRVVTLAYNEDDLDGIPVKGFMNEMLTTWTGEMIELFFRELCDQFLCFVFLLSTKG